MTNKETQPFKITNKQAQIVNAAEDLGGAKADQFDGRSLRHLQARGIVKVTTAGKVTLTKAAERAGFDVRT